MKIKQGQITALTQEQRQKISRLQMLQVHLLEMNVTELEEKIKNEIDANPALEKDYQNNDEISFDQSRDNSSDANDDESFESQKEREDKQEELDNALKSMETDDDISDSSGQYGYYGEEKEEIIYGENLNFYDSLKQQMGEIELSAIEEEIMEYIIGSLDDDGYFRKDISNLADELSIYHYIDASTEDVENTLKKLQTFDPAGIGARNLKECLEIQINRMEEGRLKKVMIETLEHHYESFTKLHWDKIKTALGLNDTQLDTLKKEFRKLNPTPGSSLNEPIKSSSQQITPDFIIHTDEDERITFSINSDYLPELIVQPDFVSMADELEKQKDKLNKNEKIALKYSKQNIENATLFIEALKQRHKTMTITMKAIINWQRKYFISGDDEDLKPMILKDIAEKTKLDISTISRVCNQKYAQTDWGIFRLKHFFTDSYTTEDGTEISSKVIKMALKEIVDKEDKKKPLSDEALAKKMKETGYPIARRTVTKYREQMDIPVARLRKE